MTRIRPGGGLVRPRARAVLVASLTLGVTAATGAALAAVPAAAAPAAAGTAVGAAGSAEAPDASARERAFAAAAAEQGVPLPLLKALSYAQTRWDLHDGHSTSGGFGPLHLVDGSLADAAPQLRGLDGADAGAAVGAAPSDTLGDAAALLHLDRSTLREDAAANVRGGAALLAAAQRDLGLPTGADSDPGAWYAAVASLSGTRQEDAARTFADDVYAVLAAGASRTTVDGQQVSLLPTGTTPRRDQLARLGLRPSDNGPVDCPEGLDCEWIPAPYERLGATGYGNHDLANRPESPAITQIVIHNTEATYPTTLSLVTNPAYVSWQYSLRSSDGHIAQHLAPRDVGWHAGNWYVNAHSVGLEHEGFAAEGAQWFSEPMYRTSARLVRHLAAEYDIPLDRQHVVGHDQVPGITPARVAGMHWDPGPYWDWEHYFDLLGAPLTAREGAPSKDVVRILPGFDDNVQPLTSCEVPGVDCAEQGTNFVYLRTEPDADAPLIRDVGLRPSGLPSTTHVSDIGARATAGVEYAVAERRGDWVAIWFNGEKGWFRNPADARTAIEVAGSYVVPKPGRESVPVYGRAYPEAAAYPAGIPVQAVVPLQYAIAAGQRYVVGDLTVPTDYYRAVSFSPDTPNDHVDVVGQDRYYQVSLGHRFAYVRAADVDVVTAR